MEGYVQDLVARARKAQAELETLASAAFLEEAAAKMAALAAAGALVVDVPWKIGSALHELGLGAEPRGRAEPGGRAAPKGRP